MNLLKDLNHGQDKAARLRIELISSSGSISYKSIDPTPFCCGNYNTFSVFGNESFIVNVFLVNSDGHLKFCDDDLSLNVKLRYYSTTAIKDSNEEESSYSDCPSDLIVNFYIN